MIKSFTDKFDGLITLKLVPDPDAFFLVSRLPNRRLSKGTYGNKRTIEEETTQLKGLENIFIIQYNVSRDYF